MNVDDVFMSVTVGSEERGGKWREGKDGFEWEGEKDRRERGRTDGRIWWLGSVVVGRWTCDRDSRSRRFPSRPAHCRVATCSHPCASVGASGLVGEYRTRNFHTEGANLAQAICKQP